MSLKPYKNILQFQKLIKFEYKAYLISEYSPIGDLYQLSSKEYFIKMMKVWKPLRGIHHLIKGIGEGLCYLHEWGIAHGDLTPNNILLFWNTESQNDSNSYDRMTPKLSGFDVSQMEGPRDPVGKVMARKAKGSLNYMAPESLENKGSYDMIVADFYSVGACLLAMLLGEHPFQATTPLPLKHVNSYEENETSFTNFTTLMKKDVNYVKNVCDVFNRQLRYVLTRLLDPSPNSRMSAEEFLKTEWISKEREFNANRK